MKSRFSFLNIPHKDMLSTKYHYSPNKITKNIGPFFNKPTNKNISRNPSQRHRLSRKTLEKLSVNKSLGDYQH